MARSAARWTAGKQPLRRAQNAGGPEATPALGRWRSSGELGATPLLLDGTFRRSGANPRLDGRGECPDRSKRTRTTANTRMRNMRTRATLGPFSNTRYNPGGLRMCGELPNERDCGRCVLGRILAQTRAMRTRANSGYAHTRDISDLRTPAVYCGNCNRCGCAFAVNIRRRP